MLACLALLLTGCGGEPSTDTTPNPPPDTTQPAPVADEARVIPVVDAEAIADLREKAAAEGKVLVVDCWATWCQSCVAMFPHLHEAMKERGDGVVLASLSFDEGDDLTQKARAFLTKQHAWDNAYQATPGSDATEAIAKALSDNWDGGILPAVFVYRPDGTTAYELLETRGEVQDWVDTIASAVDEAIDVADDPPGQ